jgi:signal transduction histidine kinase
MNTWVEPWLVMLSIFTAAVWSFTAVELAGRLRLVTHPVVRRRWLTAAAAALGTGVWGTGITGLLASRAPVAVHDDPWLIVASLVPAAGGCACVLAAAMPAAEPRRRLRVAAALAFGAAVAATLLLGSAAIHADGAARSCSAGLVLLSALPPAIAARAWLHLAFPAAEATTSLRRRVAGGALLGVGIVVGQHLGLEALRLSVPAGVEGPGAPPGLAAAAGAIVALGILGLALGQSLAHRRATEDAFVLRAVGTVLREMSAGLDGRRGVCEAVQRITGCDLAVLFEPGAGSGASPVEPTARVGSDPSPQAHRERLRHVLDAWMDEEPRLVADGHAGTLLLEPVMRNGEAAGVLCLLFPGRTGPPSRRRRAAVAMLAAEAAVAIERADLVARVRANDRAEASARLARDLHDSVSQEVALSSWYAQLAVKALDADLTDARELLVRAADQLAHAQQDMRQVLRGLREDRALHGSSTLPELIDALAAEHEQRSCSPVSVAKDVADWERVAPPVADALYFVVREALHNSLKHAGGAAVHIVLRAGPRSLSATVRDDGPGFDPDTVPEGRWGLLGMRERARNLGGIAHVVSSPGEGTTISVSVPRDGVARPVADGDGADGDLGSAAAADG